MFLLAILCLIDRGNVVLTDSCSRANGFPVNVDITDNSGIAGYPRILFSDFGKLSTSTNVYEYDNLYRGN